MDKIKSIFFAASEIAIPCLEQLIAIEQNQLVGIVTQPGRAKGRGQKYSLNPIAEWAERHHIPYFPAQTMDDEAYAWLQNKQADLMFVMSFGRILKRRFLDLAALGMWNFHTSLLPKYRGASPIQTCLYEGEAYTGVTLMKMVEALDAGPWIDQAQLAIDKRDTAASLTVKLADLTADVLKKNFDALVHGRYQLHTQDEGAVTLTHKFCKADGLLDFNAAADQLERRIRAFNPWPGTFFQIDDVCIKVHAAHVADGASDETPGTLLLGENGHALGVKCSKGILMIDQLQYPGSKILDAKTFLNGHRKLFSGQLH